MSRVLVVCAGFTLPAVVAVIGCVVDSDRYPGIDNAIPNARKGTANPSTSTGSSSSSTSGTPPPICQCAPTINSPDGGACAQCGGEAVSSAGSCFIQAQACTIDTECQKVIPCMIACTPGDQICVENCIKPSPVYKSLASCQCTACASACAVANPLPCDLDAGTGGTGGGGTGGGGTGGSDGGP